jgi:hypothetical protein
MLPYLYGFLYLIKILFQGTRIAITIYTIINKIIERGCVWRVFLDQISIEII